MEPKQSPPELEPKKSVWTEVTPVSKYLAMALFIILPFVGIWIGYSYGPEKVVEVEKATIIESDHQLTEEEGIEVETVEYKVGEYIDETVTLKEIGSDSGGGDDVNDLIVLVLSPDRQTEEFTFVRIDSTACVDSNISNGYSDTIRVAGKIQSVVPEMSSLILSCDDASVFPTAEWPIVSMSMRSTRDAENIGFSCDHSHLKTISDETYATWPVYVDDELSLSFVYPPDQAPNVEERFTDDDGVGYFRVGFNPNLTAPFAGMGKPHLHKIDDTWQVEVYKPKADEQLINSGYCSNRGHWWCLLEEVDLGLALDTFVYSSESFGMLAPDHRGYHMYSKDGLVVDVSLPAATGDEEGACSVIPKIFNIDLIAHSLALQTLIETELIPDDTFDNLKAVTGMDSKDIEIRILVESNSAENVKMSEGFDLGLPEDYQYITNGFIEITLGEQTQKEYRVGIKPTSEFEVVMGYDGDALEYRPFVSDDDGTVWAFMRPTNGSIMFALMNVPDY